MRFNYTLTDIFTTTNLKLSAENDRESSILRNNIIQHSLAYPQQTMENALAAEFNFFFSTFTAIASWPCSEAPVLFSISQFPSLSECPAWACNNR